MGVTGAMAGDASRCSISFMVIEAPKVLEVFFKLVAAFFLKRAKCISTGIRQTMDNVREKEAYTRGGALAKGKSVIFPLSASRAAVVFLEAPPSIFSFLPPSAASEVELFRFCANGASSSDTMVTSFIFGS